MALYNKMRPRCLADVKGQDKVVKILKDNLSSGNLPNAMLFIGTRGTGKTSVARIVARMVNCENPKEDGSCCNECESCKGILAGSSLDVIELDAASNNGVDNVREILQNISYKAVGKKKVVILDEVHMLSMGAFNALLKALEEPPKGVLFILCTTEFQKIPATILSRCRKYQFETIADELIIEKLEAANKLYGKQAERDALLLVAKAAKGSMRDAESIYEAFLDTQGTITVEMVRNTLGFSSEDNIFSILDAIKEGNPIIANATIEDVCEKGGSLSCLLEDCFNVLMDIIAISLGGDLSGMKDSYVEKISEYAFFFSSQRLYEIANAFQSTYAKRSSNMVFALKAMLIGLACSQSTITQLEERVSSLEKTVGRLMVGGISLFSESVSSDEYEADCEMPVCTETGFVSDMAPGEEMVERNEETIEKPTTSSDFEEDMKMPVSSDVLPSGGASNKQEMPPMEEESKKDTPAPTLSEANIAELVGMGFVFKDNFAGSVPFEEEELTAEDIVFGNGESAFADSRADETVSDESLSDNSSEAGTLSECETGSEQVAEDSEGEDVAEENDTAETSTGDFGDEDMAEASFFDDFVRHFGSTFSL